MAPDPHLLASLAANLGTALAFADDVSERQLQVAKHGSTSAAVNANARSCLIGLLRDEPLAHHRLLEDHTDLNKIVVQRVESKTRYWMKSAAAVAFTFEQATPLFSFPSDLHVLTFGLFGDEVEFQYAPISRSMGKRFKRYKLESTLAELGRYPLGGAVPPGGYPTDRVTGIFDGGVEDTYDDLFPGSDEEGSAEESA